MSPHVLEATPARSATERPEEPEPVEHDRHLFVGYCWGAAGTTWLAKVLNAHPEMLALHAPSAKGARRSDDEWLHDAISFFFHARDQGGAYPVCGFTHGIGVHHHQRLTKRFGHLRGFVVVRHPIARAQSHHRLLCRLQDIGEGWGGMHDEVGRSTELARERGVKVRDDAASIAFYHNMDALNRVVYERRHDVPFFRAEDLFTDPDAVGQLVNYVSNGTLELDHRLIERLQGNKVGAHDGRNTPEAETWATWSEHQREAFAHLVSEEALNAYTELGYDLPPFASGGPR